MMIAHEQQSSAVGIGYEIKSLGINEHLCAPGFILILTITRHSELHHRAAPRAGIHALDGASLASAIENFELGYDYFLNQ